MQDNDTPNRPARPRDATRPRGDAPDRPRTKQPTWVIDKERARRASAAETVWLFGLHAVRDALANRARERLRLVLTRNAADRLGSIVGASGMEPEIVDARSFDKVVPLAGESVHQGAALEVKPLGWGKVEDVVLAAPPGVRPLVVAVGRLHPQKGYDVLLDALGRWSGRSSAPLFAIAGDGPLQDELADRVAAERLPVVLLGRRGDVADLLGAADVCVLPSRWEGSPFTAQEALRAMPLFPKRLGRAEEIARLVLAIAANPLLNGETIRADAALRLPPQ